MLLGNIVLNSAFVAVILALAASSPLINIETDMRQGVFALEQLERAAVTGLVACNSQSVSDPGDASRSQARREKES